LAAGDAEGAKPQRLRPDRTARACAIVLATALLAGCARTGDFGRIEGPSEPESLAFLHADPVPTGALASRQTLTDDERELRALGANLLRPPHAPEHRFAWASPPADDPPAGGPHDLSRYSEMLLRGPFRSAAARYARLIDDTRNDIDRLAPFFVLARRVVDLDRKRERSVAVIPGLSPQAVADAHRRVYENRRLIADVHHALTARTAMYRYALERLVVTLPSPMAVQAERTRMELERNLVGLSAFAGAGVAVALPPPPPITKP
jgi:hypothetical protein